VARSALDNSGTESSVTLLAGPEMLMAATGLSASRMGAAMQRTPIWLSSLSMA